MSTTSLNPSLAGDAARLLIAEAVFPGHPDKLADQIADGIVDIAIAHDERAIYHSAEWQRQRFLLHWRTQWKRSQLHLQWARV